MEIALRRAADKGRVTLPHVLTPAKRRDEQAAEARDIAYELRRLDVVGRWTPESALLAKDALAERLFALAGRLEA